MSHDYKNTNNLKYEFICILFLKNKKSFIKILNCLSKFFYNIKNKLS